MFKINKRNTMPTNPDVGAAKTRASTTLGSYTSKTSTFKIGDDDEFQSLSSMRPSNQPGMNIGHLPVMLDTQPTLAGFMYDREDRNLVDIYKDIYYYDVVAGTAVDLLSFLPFSDFTLRGVKDEDKSPFLESIERLQIHSLLPEISVDYLVTGNFIGSLVFNQKKKVFVDIVPQDFKHCTITSFPFYGIDPLISVNLPPESTKILSSSNERIQQIIASYGKEVVAKLLSGNLDLDPLATVYIPRRTMTSSEGTSYYRRVLPIYFLEKNIFRGTLAESIKRQRAILHIMAGDMDWEASSEDLKFLSELFINADNDPLGAIVATRQGVSTSEIRQGGDFWRVEDLWNSTVPAKLKALNISEDFINGAASVNTMEASMSGFVEQLRSYREMLTRKLFYQKLFPLISLTNELYVDDAAKARADELRNKAGRNADIATMLYQVQDTSSLTIPQIDWQKNLKPEGDTGYMELLRTMTENGVPIPIRAMAAAGGIQIDSILKQEDEDIETRKKLSEYQKRIKELVPTDGDDDDSMYASALGAAFDSLSPARKAEILEILPTRSAIMNANGRASFFRKAKESEQFEADDVSRTGKRKFRYNQADYQRTANENMVKARRRMRRKGSTL